MGQKQSVQRSDLESSVIQIGPHGYPTRFGVRLAGVKGFKIYGTDPKQPLRYVEWHTRRQVLHQSGHKKDNSPPVVTVHENWPSWSILPLDDDAPAFTITVHDNAKQAVTDRPESDEASPDESSPIEPILLEPTPIEESPVVTSSDTPNANKKKTKTKSHDAKPEKPNPKTTDITIVMDHTRCRPVTFKFELPITTLQPDGTITTTLEAFEWRRAAHACQETRGIRKNALPLMETGDERLPEARFVYSASGSVLVRLNGKRCTPGKNRPLGFTKEGEEIVASYSDSRDYRTWYYFQFWGSGATGELGEMFTNVAVMTGLAVFQDEEGERTKGNHSSGSSADLVHHGVSPPLTTVMPPKADRPGRGSRFGFFYDLRASQQENHERRHSAA